MPRLTFLLCQDMPVGHIAHVHKVKASIHRNGGLLFHPGENHLTNFRAAEIVRANHTCRADDGGI